jgi:hypothetical protein
MDGITMQNAKALEKVMSNNLFCTFFVILFLHTIFAGDNFSSAPWFYGIY